MTSRRPRCLVAGALVGALGAGCAHLGPKTVGRERPADAYAAVFYRGYWFWIDDGDWQTKRALSAVMFFFTLGETGGTDKLPQVTIPAQ